MRLVLALRPKRLLVVLLCHSFLRRFETLGVRRETNLRQSDLGSAGPYCPRDIAIRKAISGAEMPVMHKLTESAEGGREPMLHARALCVVHLGGAAPNPPGYLENRDETCMQRSFFQKKLAQRCT